MDKKILYLVDGSSYIYRAYYAIRHLSSHKGFPTNAIFGFTKMLLKVLKDVHPDHVGIVFDAGRSTFRHQLFPEYKSNRVSMPDDLRVQLSPIKEVVKAFRIPCLELEGYEADDIIGTIAADCRRAGMGVVIVTGDKDLMQLVNEEVTLLDTMKDKHIGVTEVVERFGVPPENVIDILGLCGDTSDNIPGVPGIGEKTAIKLLAEFGSLENLLSHLSQVKGKVAERLETFADQARLSKELATIDCNVPISWSYDDFMISKPDTAALSALFREYGFTGLMKELTAESVLSSEQYRIVEHLEDLRKLVLEAESVGRFALEVLGDATSATAGGACGIAISFRSHEAWYIPLQTPIQDNDKTFSSQDVFRTLSPLLMSSHVKKCVHDIKRLFQMLWPQGVDLTGPASDLMLVSYLLNPSRGGHTLDSLAVEFLDHKKTDIGELLGKGKLKREIHDLDVEAAAAYTCENAAAVLLLDEDLQRRLDDSGMTDLLQQVEMPLARVLAKMEMCGVRLNVSLLQDLSSSLAAELSELEAKIYDLAGGPFNISSPKQLGDILFERLKLPAGKRTKTGWSTDVDVLTRLAEVHQLPHEVLRFRSLTKLKTTYTDVLPKLVDATTGCVHTTYNQAVTATGRLSSSDPNLQNIPVRTEEGRKIRQAFVPSEGYLLLAADYSQIELRVLAHLSKDEVLLDAFAKGEDVHRRTASEVFGVEPDNVTPEMRRQAKTINFGVIYGQSPFGLANELGISQKLAKEFIESYFVRHCGARNYLDACIADAERDGYVSTILGRKLPIPDIKSPSFQLRAFAQRNAVNYPVQGSAADIIKLSMVNISQAMEKAAVMSRMLMQVHDELVFEVEPSEKELMESLVRSEMEQAIQLAVPLRVDLHFGLNWHEAH